MRAKATVGIDISSGVNQTGYNRRTVGKVTRPVGRCMEQGSIARPVTDARGCQPRIGAEQPLERMKITSLDGLGGRYCPRVISWYEPNGVPLI